MAQLRIGTCSWKYPSWNGLVYSAQKGINYLEEYANRYKTVEVDQWFWSLFQGSRVKLPSRMDVETYSASVPDDFRFTVKAPNSLTLTHYYKKSKTEPLEINPHFLSSDLLFEFLALLEPMKALLGPIIFQFEYLNKQKMVSQALFMERLDTFVAKLPRSYDFAIELRNNAYLNNRYFEFLNEHRISPVFLQGYWMPKVTEVFQRFRSSILKQQRAVIRLHGPDRGDIEKKTKKVWDKIVEQKDDELAAVAEMIRDLRNADLEVYLNVNNHYEGSAPITIDRIEKMLL